MPHTYSDICHISSRKAELLVWTAIKSKYLSTLEALTWFCVLLYQITSQDLMTYPQIYKHFSSLMCDLLSYLSLVYVYVYQKLFKDKVHYKLLSVSV